MGYNLTIGEAKIITYAEDGLEADCTIGAERIVHHDAPAFGEPTDSTNERWPSYTSWWEFCEFVGLTHAIYDSEQRSLRGGHPGAFPINEKFKKEVDLAMARLIAKYPNAVASYGENENDIPEENGAMCRLIWLQYWTDWALENCETPVLANT